MRAAADFTSFYATRQPAAGDEKKLLVLQVDGKGIVMRPDALRPATAKAAEATSPKLASRLSKGEKRYRKRIAEVGAAHASITSGVVLAAVITVGPGGVSWAMDASER